MRLTTAQKAQRGHRVSYGPSKGSREKKIHDEHLVNKCENLDNDQSPKNICV